MKSGKLNVLVIDCLSKTVNLRVNKVNLKLNKVVLRFHAIFPCIFAHGMSK